MSLTKVTYSMISGTPVNVLDFGAVGDGVTDDAAAIQAADTAARAAKTSVVFEGKTYLIKSPLTISVPWFGVSGQTIIEIPSDFVYDTGSFDPRRYSAITNLNCAAAYNDNTADEVYISGIKFVDDGDLNGDTMGLANVKAGCISDCVFEATTSFVKTPLDLFACVKNLTVERCKILNLTENASGGGGMWVRNITSDGTLAANVTENIQIVDCYFEQTALDEAFAIYGVLGLTKNIRVSRCTFNGSIASAVKHGNLATAFPLGNGANAAVQDVVFSECRFETDNFINHVLRIGQTGDELFVCKDIRVENCYFKASLPAAGTSAVARNIANTGGNITFVNNIVDAEGSANTITQGVLAFDLAADTTVIGNLSEGFSNCSVVDACISKSITGNAAVNCARITNSVLSSAGTCVVNSATRQFEVSNNRIEVTATSGAIFGVIFNSVGGSAPFGEIMGNTISLNNAAATAIRADGSGAGNTRVCGNRANGTGKTVSGTQLKEIQGNDWYGNLDSMRSAGYLDFDHNNATPIGTFAGALTHTAGANSYLLGFIKTANAGVAGDWKSVYAGNALT